MLRYFLAAVFLITVMPWLAWASESERFSLGTTPDPAEINRMDIDVMPDGRGLPEGEGSVERGEAVYTRACAHCHGDSGHGGPHGSLAGERFYSPAQFAADTSLKRTVGNYWPYATSVFDYIRRAMPFDRPGSLSNDEVYAVTAYLLHLNNLLDNKSVLNRESIVAVEMPAAKFFVPASSGLQGQ